MAGDGYHARELGAWRTLTSDHPSALQHTPLPARSQAAANLNNLQAEQLDQFSDVLEMENPDLYKWLTGATATLGRLQSVRTPPLSVPQASRKSPATCTTRCCERSALTSRRRWCAAMPLREESRDATGCVADACPTLASIAAWQAPKVTVTSTSSFEGKVWE